MGRRAKASLWWTIVRSTCLSAGLTREHVGIRCLQLTAAIDGDGAAPLFSRHWYKIKYLVL